MKQDTNAAGDYYCIGHLVQLTGLTDRTIRSYMACGILKGEKINGLWHFTPEQVEAFLRDPAVRPSIQGKNNGLVYEFLRNPARERHQGCMILDFPGADPKQLTEYFCYAICNGDYHNFQFAYDGLDKTPRVILRGETEQMLRLVNGYYK